MALSERLKLIQGGEDPDLPLGQLLAYYRKRAGADQAEMAEQLGLSRQAISDWERGATVPARMGVLAWCLLTGAPFSQLEPALNKAWFARNGGTKRTSAVRANLDPERRSGSAIKWLQIPSGHTEWWEIADEETLANAVLDLRDSTEPHFVAGPNGSSASVG